MNTAKVHRKKSPAVASHGAKKIVVDFPEALFRETESAVAELSTSRSDFIRLAVEEYIRQRRLKKLHEQLIEGYVANANAARKVAEEFAQFD